MTNYLIITINRIVLIFFILILITACNNGFKKEIKRRNIYDFEVLYLYQGHQKVDDDKYRFKFSKDSLYIMVESEFKNCNLNIKENGEIIFNDIINTEESSGFAKELVRGNIQNIYNIDVSIDFGPVISFEILNSENNIVGIRKEKDKIQIVFYKRSPLYY